MSSRSSSCQSQSKVQSKAPLELRIPPQKLHHNHPPRRHARLQLGQRARDGARLYTNLDHLTYWGVLHHAALLVGNSSSGIMETASIPLPTVDVGLRQQGRTRAANVIHATPDRPAIGHAIDQALQPRFRASLDGIENPYGDGRASKRIADGLAAAPDRDVLLLKRALPLSPNEDRFEQ